MTLQSAISLVQAVVEDLAFEVDIKAPARCRYRQTLLEAVGILQKCKPAAETVTEGDTPIDKGKLSFGETSGSQCCETFRGQIEKLEQALVQHRDSQKSAVQAAVEGIGQRAAIQNQKHAEFKNEIRAFLDQCSSNDRKDYKMRIGSPFSSVAKPSPKFRRQTELSFAQECKGDAKNLLEYFDFPMNNENQTPQRSQKGGSSSKYSEGGLLPPRVVESAEKRGLKKNFMTFKNALLSEEKQSERKNQPSYGSELDLPDFTLECLTNREVDAQQVADQYDVGESCQRPLLHVEEHDLQDIRSLPISLKGSSTFQ